MPAIPLPAQRRPAAQDGRPQKLHHRRRGADVGLPAARSGSKAHSPPRSRTEPPSAKKLLAFVNFRYQTLAQERPQGVAER